MSRIFLLFPLLIAFATSKLYDYSDEEVLVTIKDGSLRGEITPDGQARAFRGIPYATPPVGDLRWKDPQPHQGWTGVRNATKDGRACVQNCTLPPWACPPLDQIGEDCLFLNVFTPRAKDKKLENLPVMFFVHGGNFEWGWAGGILYDGRYITNHTDVVLVVINYRMGLFGFLASEELSGNYGLLDQTLAMKWTRDNIAAFGGDPDHITFFGQSAGAMSGAVHMMKEFTPSHGLFSKAILESEPFGIPMRPVKDYDNLARVFAKRLKCAKGDMACLRSKSADEILVIQDKLARDIFLDLKRPLEVFVPFTPVIGGDLVKSQPIDAFLAGDIIDVPMIMGNTAQEGVIFVYEGFTKPINSEEYYGLIGGIFGLKYFSKIAKQYPPIWGAHDQRPQMTNATTDGIFLCPNRNVTRTIVEKGKEDMWYYFFDHPAVDPSPWGNQTYCYNVSCHASELPYLYHDFPWNNVFKVSAEEEQLSEQMVTYWTNFAKSGDPNKPVSPKVNWPAYRDKFQNLRIRTPVNQVQTDLDKFECDYWDQHIGYKWID